MSPKLTRALTAMLAACLLSLSSFSQADTVKETPSALAMTGDALFARPALLAMTVAGSAVYLVSLPFSLLGGNASEAGKVLVVDPAKATFVRCLGCTMSGRADDNVVNASAPSSSSATQ
ncbi:hypothetical protein [Mangrovitalea sediminis]|uniref:hypothetical protein n=1 Tax=Mangrovitalea sediminis TaxID=1982043 RepID=UPI000BE55241|nr:hypothetical protein [Mangrovitalea sediminis]